MEPSTLNTVGYGLGAIYGSSIQKVRHVVWKEELGLAQAMWFLEVKNFGPLIVECDSRGNSMFEKEERADRRDLPAAVRQARGAGPEAARRGDGSPAPRCCSHGALSSITGKDAAMNIRESFDRIARIKVGTESIRIVPRLPARAPALTLAANAVSTVIGKGHRERP